ncbi:MAG TPA: glycosyltransferase family 2 protein [Geminicoccus sp.]|jgi:hypothetical protein|uniref:glycosyltransferase family 2 protein n=1 Tax=Geminicoccus sp. TaxID=2024832 RepID=UPI002E364EDA|nr:glycosyltransferase family 2 protein [Geminicoccus sp.]HEX2525484.1 glycosyltransferase family 2 protein [Geminicoccus sp.]
MAEVLPPTFQDDELVAIIVLNHNGRELLMACLEAVGRLHWRHVVTVVVDNASSDGSADAVRLQFPSVTLIEQTCNLGVSGGRNAGLAWVMAHHQPHHLLFIDNDTLLEPDTVGALVRAARHSKNIGIVAAKAYRRPGDRRLVSAGGMRFNPYLGAAWDVGSEELACGQYDQPCNTEACPGSAFFVRAGLFGLIGGFDEGLNPYGWEDVEFSLRARAAAWRIVYAPEAVVYHLGGRAGRGPVDTYEQHKARNLLRILRRHATVFQLMCVALLLPPRAAHRVGKELAGGNWRVVGAWIMGVMRRAGR